MKLTHIKHVVFDIGNVIVRWAPQEITRLALGEVDQSEKRAQELFGGDIWLGLNRGELTEEEAYRRYKAEHGLSSEQAKQLLYYAKETQLLLFGSIDLIKRVKAAGYRVYALTDNIAEVVSYLKSRYDFWPLFDGTTVSADVGTLKPQPEIYQHLLTEHQLEPSECVFLDDMPHNVAGAKAQGMHAIQFQNVLQGERELRAMGLSF